MRRQRPMMRRSAGAVLLTVVVAGLTACTTSGSGSPGPTSAPSSPTAPLSPSGLVSLGGTAGSTAVPAQSKDVTFTIAGTTTYGTLDVPAHATGQKLAAALLLAGSGPTDRNGNQPSSNLTPNTLKLIADQLAQQGIMSLRFDKYFSGQTGGGAFTSDPSSISVSAFRAQADAAYDQLLKEPDVDSTNMLIVGHSEGGKYALLTAESVTPRPAGLALIEPASERSLDLIQVQVGEQLKAMETQGTITAAVAQSNAAIVKQAVADFRAGRPVDTTGLMPALANLMDLLLTGTNANYNLGDDKIVPATLAGMVDRGTQVLVTDGTDDTNVPPSTIGPLVQALKSAGTNGPGLVLLPGVNHELHLANESTNDQVLAPAVTTAIRQWAQPFATS